VNDEVGVDPERVAQAAAALEQLRDALAANVPAIVNTLNEYWSSGAGTPVDIGPLRRAAARSVQDAADMRTHANLAAAFMANPVNIDVVASGVAWIPWSGPALDQAAAELDAQDLSSAIALARTDPAAARSAIAAIAQDLQDHADDAAFLRDFWSQPGTTAAAANIASVLRTTSSGKRVSQPSVSDRDNVLAILASAAIPIGFSGTKAYMQFAQQANDGLATAGYPNATVAIRGSSVTGIRYSTGEPVGDSPNDYDLAIADPDLILTCWPKPGTSASRCAVAVPAPGLMPRPAGRSSLSPTKSKTKTGNSSSSPTTPITRRCCWPGTRRRARLTRSRSWSASGAGLPPSTAWTSCVGARRPSRPPRNCATSVRRAS
jgi:hypothetical protein